MTLRRANLSLPATDEAHNGPLSLLIGGIRDDFREQSVTQLLAPNVGRLTTDVTDRRGLFSYPCNP
jgi:hypothetical protein